MANPYLEGVGESTSSNPYLSGVESDTTSSNPYLQGVGGVTTPVASETNWAGTGPKMTTKEYFKSGFGGRFVTHALRDDHELSTEADKIAKESVGDSWNKDLESNKKYKEIYNTEYKRLVTEREDAIKAEKAKNPEPSFTESLGEFGKQVITSPWQTAKSMVYELGKDPEFALLGVGGAPKLAEATAAVGRAAKVAKAAKEVGVGAAKAGAIGATAETAAEVGEPGGLDLQRIANTAGTFAVLGATLHAGAKGVKSIYEAGKTKVPTVGEFEDLHNKLNDLEAEIDNAPTQQTLPGIEEAKGPQPRFDTERIALEAQEPPKEQLSLPLEEQVNKDIADNPELSVAGEIFKSFKDESPIEAIKSTIRELKVNNRLSTLWRRAIETAVPELGIRERITMAMEGQRKYDKLLTDEEKRQTLYGDSPEVIDQKIAKNQKINKGLVGVLDVYNKALNDELNPVASETFWGNYIKKWDLIGKTNEEIMNHLAEKTKSIQYVVDHLKSLGSEEHAFEVMRQVETKLKEIGEVAKQQGLMEGLRRNYISHVLNFNESSLNEAQRRSLADRLFGDRTSRFNRDFTQQRHYEFIRDLEEALHAAGKEMGLDTKGVKVERDVAKIAEIYQKSMMKAVLEKKLLNHLEKLTVLDSFGGEIPLLTKSADVAFKNGYEFFKGKDAGALEGYAVHPDLVTPLKFLFRQTDPNVIMKALGSVSMLAKYINTMGSLFHATSLFVARMTSTPGTMLKEIFTAGSGTKLALEELERNGASESVKLAQRSGLVIDLPEDASRTILTDISDTVDKGISKVAGNKVKVVGRVIDPVENLLLTKMNRFTWDYMHAAGKLHTFQTWFTKIKTRNPELPDEVIAKEVASYVNNTLGGLDWLEVADQVKNKYGRALAMWALNSQGRDLLQILLFAPDWTISTLRSFTKALPQEIMKPKNWELREGMKGFINPKTQGDLARRYVANTALAWLVVLNGFNMAFTGRPIWTNKDPTRVDLNDGTSMQMAKHSMEAFHWILDPEKTLGNKMGFWPKAVITMTTGKAYPSPDAPMIKDNTALGRALHSASQALPFQVNAAFSAPTGEKLKRAVASFAGVPIYGQTDKMHTSPEVRMERKLQRKESRRENKLEKMKRR